MQILIQLFGDGKDLNALQMGIRGIIVFFIALILIRISGRRSFGQNTPLDNIVVITLGAILSRAIVGASSFMPIVSTCFVIVLLHRFLAWLMVHHSQINKLVEGNKIILFEYDNFIDKNLDKALVCKEDIMQGIRKTALTENLAKIDRVYMERNGEITVVKKEIE